MDERTAKIVSDALGGTAWQTGGGIWIVRIPRRDGSVVVITEDCVADYASDDAFDNGVTASSIALV